MLSKYILVGHFCIIGALRRSFSKLPNNYLNNREKPENNIGKMGMLKNSIHGLS